MSPPVFYPVSGPVFFWWLLFSSLLGPVFFWWLLFSSLLCKQPPCLYWETPYHEEYEWQKTYPSSVSILGGILMKYSTVHYQVQQESV